MFLQVDPEGASTLRSGDDPFPAGEPVIFRHEEAPAPQVKGNEILWWGNGLPTERLA
jgi:hypothetical protein